MRFVGWHRVDGGGGSRRSNVLVGKIPRAKAIVPYRLYLTHIHVARCTNPSLPPANAGYQVPSTGPLPERQQLNAQGCRSTVPIHLGVDLRPGAWCCVWLFTLRMVDRMFFDLWLSSERGRWPPGPPPHPPPSLSRRKPNLSCRREWPELNLQPQSVVFNLLVRQAVW